MKLKFTKEEMAFLNTICDIEVNAEGVKTYSMKPMVVDDEGCTYVEMVDIFKLASENKFLSDPSIDFKFKYSATKIIDEKEALCRDNSFEISILRERAKKDAFFDTMIKDGIKVGMAVHLYDMMYGVSEIDHVNKKITLRRGDNQLFDYFELLKSNQ